MNEWNNLDKILKSAKPDVVSQNDLPEDEWFSIQKRINSLNSDKAKTKIMWIWIPSFTALVLLVFVLMSSQRAVPVDSESEFYSELNFSEEESILDPWLELAEAVDGDTG